MLSFGRRTKQRKIPLYRPTAETRGYQINSRNQKPSIQQQESETIRSIAGIRDHQVNSRNQKPSDQQQKSEVIRSTSERLSILHKQLRLMSHRKNLTSVKRRTKQCSISYFSYAENKPFVQIINITQSTTYGFQNCVTDHQHHTFSS